jgi:hypothetical protein
MSLWTAAASSEPAFDFPAPSAEELAQLVEAQLADREFEKKLAKRLAPYRPRQLSAEELHGHRY